MINPNINGNRHQLLMMQPNRDLLVEGGGSTSGPSVVGGVTQLDLTQDAIDGFNNGTKTIDELKAALDSAGIKYQDNGSTLTFEYKNKPYTITYQTETTTASALDKAMKDMGLRDTYYKGVYCEINKPQGQQKHYFWDEANQKMVEIPNVFYVSKDGHEVADFIKNYLTGNVDTTKGTETTDNKKWEGDVDQKLKDLEAKYNSILNTIKNNGGQVSSEMQKQLDEIKALIDQIKAEDNKNIDMGKLDLDLESITGYKTNTNNSMLGKKMKDGQALKDEAASILNSLKDKMYSQLLTQAKSLGIPENEFKTMFEQQFDNSVDSTVNNPKYVWIVDSWIDALDSGNYRVKTVVDAFIEAFGAGLKAKIESWKDKNPSESIQNKFEQIENTLKAVDKEVTSDTNSKVTINKDTLNLNNISGYKTNTKNKIAGKALKNGDAIRDEARNVINETKDNLYKQLLAQVKSLGIPEADFKTMFDKVYTTASARAIDKHVTVLDLPGKIADMGSYKVQTLINGFLDIFGSLFNEELVKYQLKH